METRARLVHEFVTQHRRRIATTLRDVRDDDRVYVLLGELAADCASLPYDMTPSLLTQDEVLRRFDRNAIGTQYCLDQMNSLRSKAHCTSDVVVGIAFGSDLVTFITRISPA